MARELPELTGWELEQARERLASLGWRVEVKETSPPRHRLQGP